MAILSIHNKLKNFTILIVDDDVDSALNLSRLLKSECKEVLLASNGNEGWELFKNNAPQIVFTDIQMPVADGFSLIEKIRLVNKETIIFVITGFPKEEHILQAINLNLENFIIKPLSKKKLDDILQRVALKCETSEVPICQSKNIFYHTKSKTIKDEKEIYSLTNMEIYLFELLLHYKNSIVSYEQIERIVYQEGTMTSSSLRGLIKRLRKKLPRVPIINIQDVGYILQCD